VSDVVLELERFVTARAEDALGLRLDDGSGRYFEGARFTAARLEVEQLALGASDLVIRGAAEPIDGTGAWSPFGTGHDQPEQQRNPVVKAVVSRVKS
jgi:hypothetical protein